MLMTVQRDTRLKVDVSTSVDPIRFNTEKGDSSKGLKSQGSGGMTASMQGGMKMISSKSQALASSSMGFKKAVNVVKVVNHLKQGTASQSTMGHMSSHDREGGLLVIEETSVLQL
tara:strand:+ start:211 stop:555 length:345 start_codon:yes stop_codon:yes gene_type:complete